MGDIILLDLGDAKEIPEYILGSYDKVVVICGARPPKSIIYEVIGALDKADVVYVVEEDTVSTRQNVGVKVLNYILSMLAPKSQEIEDPLACIVGFRTDSINPRSIKIFPPLILPSILSHASRDIRMHTIVLRGQQVGRVDVLGIGEVARALIGLGKTTGELARIVKFGFFGIFLLFLNEFFLWFITELIGLVYYFSALITYQLVTIVGFLMNEFLVFHGRNLAKGVRPRVLRFVKWNLASWMASLVSWGILVGLGEFLGVYYLVANFVAIVVGSLLIFLMSFEKVWGE